jgi:Contractile injection system tube protein
MERVAFLIERTGERLECLLNPATFTFTRQAGVRPMRSLGVALSGVASADDPLVSTGGGRTELTLELLFDVSKQSSARPESSVQALTAPLWNLAENSDDSDGHGSPPLVRFVWGKAWNVPAVVVSVAERFEQFTPEGVPQRSWLKLRLVRCGSPVTAATVAPVPVPLDDESLEQWLQPLPDDQVQVHEVAGERTTDDSAPGQVERIEQLAFRYFGDAALWPVLAAFNGLEDPARMPAGTVLRVPPAGAMK